MHTDQHLDSSMGTPTSSSNRALPGMRPLEYYLAADWGPAEGTFYDEAAKIGTG